MVSKFTAQGLRFPIPGRDIHTGEMVVSPLVMAPISEFPFVHAAPASLVWPLTFVHMTTVGENSEEMGPEEKRKHRYEIGNGKADSADLSRWEEGAGRAGVMTRLNIGSYSLEPVTLYGRGRLQLGWRVLRSGESPELWGGPEL